MARPRKPSNVLELSGAYRKNPQRRREEPKVASELGEPPKHFDDIRQAAWREVVGMAPEGVLTKSDRLAVEMLADLIARYRASMQPGGERFTSADRRDMLAILSRIGATPADRSRVATPKRDDETIDMFDALAALAAQGG